MKYTMFKICYKDYCMRRFRHSLPIVVWNLNFRASLQSNWSRRGIKTNTNAKPFRKHKAHSEEYTDAVWQDAVQHGGVRSIEKWFENFAFVMRWSFWKWKFELISSLKDKTVKGVMWGRCWLLLCTGHSVCVQHVSC